MVGYDSGDYVEVIGKKSDTDWLWSDEELQSDPGFRMYVVWYKILEREV